MKLLISAGCVASFSNAADDIDTSTQWARDVISKCQVLIPWRTTRPDVFWVGACVDGKASGKGKVSTFGLQLEGEFREGRPFNAQGWRVDIAPDGRREPYRLNYALGQRDEQPPEPVAGGERMDIAAITGTWRVESLDGSCADFIEYEKTNLSDLWANKQVSRSVVRLYELNARPEWMALSRMELGDSRKLTCRGQLPEQFGMTTVYLRRAGEGYEYCNAPEATTCFARATRVSEQAWTDAVVSKPAERNLITSKAGRLGGVGGEASGINTASGKAGSVSNNSIDAVLDRNKGAFYALYGRALRDNPQMQGKFRYRLAIAVNGEVTQCTVLSSELGDPELERKLCARLSLVRFGTQPETMTIERSIDFFPAA